MLGRYELIRPLARGGMAELFLARRRASGGVEKRMVIKRIRRERARDARFAAMFVREARLSMSLAHKNIVPVFDFGRAGDELFLVMEFVDGVDLASALARAGEVGAPPAPVLVAFIGLEACQALEYAHQAGGNGEEQGVVHRDVTPANVLLSYSGEVKLLDFGIAISETAVGEATGVRGTPPYMAPEQARGEAVSPRTDVFALGLVLWEALAGKRAYAAVDSREALALARRGEVPTLQPDRAPAPLRAIVERATRVEPDERFADAGAMQLALDEYLVDARAGLERRGPAHQQLAAWVRELYPEREGQGSPTAVVVPDGPVATFLDDGEERVTALFPAAAGDGATARSVASTAPDAEAQPETAERAESGKRAASGASRMRGRVWPAGGALVAAVAAILLARNLASRPEAEPSVVAKPGGAAPGVAARPSAPGESSGSADRPSGAAGEPGSGDARPPARVLADRPSGAAGEPGSGDARRPARDPAGGRRGSGAARAGAVRASGTVRVSSSPWAEVRVVGRPERCPDTPCTLRLPAGPYTLSLRNPVARLGKDVNVVVEAGETITVRETLTSPR
jgi:eukaryotic-like serine/threonine-protein kinase